MQPVSPLSTLCVPPAASHDAADGVVHECPDCGLFSRLTAPEPGTDQRCPRCERILRRAHHNSLNRALAATLSGLAFYGVAVDSPQLQVFLYGRTRLSTLADGPVSLGNQGLVPLASIVMLTIILMPLIKLLGMLAVLLGVRLREPPRFLPPLFGWLKHLNHWVMVEVYMLGFMVAYTRLQNLMVVHLDMAAFAMAGLMVSLIALDALLDPEDVWNALARCGLARQTTAADCARPPAGTRLFGCDTCHHVSAARAQDPCPRCGDALRDRKPNSLARCLAFTLSAASLYVPSNMFPIMTVTKFGKVQSYTIFQGVVELVHIGLWPLGVLVFVASIAIPTFKLLALGGLLHQARRGDPAHVRRLTALYRLIDFIGRWSMIDVFMVAILTALVQFGKLALVQANWGVLYFGSVVVLTMLAVDSFDPRLMWDSIADQQSTQRRARGAESLPA